MYQRMLCILFNRVPEKEQSLWDLKNIRHFFLQKLVERTKKTQEQANKDAQAQKKTQSNTFNLLGTSLSSLPSKVDLRDRNIVSIIALQIKH